MLAASLVREACVEKIVFGPSSCSGASGPVRHRTLKFVQINRRIAGAFDEAVTASLEAQEVAS